MQKVNIETLSCVTCAEVSFESYKTMLFRIIVMVMFIVLQSS